MANFIKFKKTMEVEGEKFDIKITLEASPKAGAKFGPDEEFVVMQQLAEIEAQGEILKKQIAGQI